jgi:L-amino acid N-acyltransferase YncA
VFEDNAESVGFAYTSRLRGRKSCDHSVESTISLKNGFVGQGSGFQLYSKLLSQPSAKYQAVIAGISLSNMVGIRFHERCGYERAHRFSEAAKKFGEWIDIGFWQRLKCD